ncbi:hypothetical protein ACIQV3_39385 [Streptomyces sp. NPDC099050]|uniref:hypothetical protein n=1 Tax=Streptomyces sp. NPDC099050 TaxID=3366100 RepID=UPI003801067C
MTTTTMRLTPVIGGRRGGGETVPRPDLEPIYAALVQEWQNTGRLDPGRHEEEGATLARRYPWPHP